MNNKMTEAIIGDLLRQRSLKLAFAESCTGGLISHRITNVPGSSDYFMGSVVAYDPHVKVNLLAVQEETLEQYGIVSAETVIAMARGVRNALSADIGLSTSGIAGPGGGTPQIPVGTVWIGLSTPEVDKAWYTYWEGSRIEVKEQATQQVLNYLLEFLVEE
jgi:PncC family amidohydrolase